MQAYLVTIFVTLEQEEAIKQLYLDRGWLYKKTKLDPGEGTQPVESAKVNFESLKQDISLAISRENGHSREEVSSKSCLYKNARDKTEKYEMSCDPNKGQIDEDRNNLITRPQGVHKELNEFPIKDADEFEGATVFNKTQKINTFDEDEIPRGNMCKHLANRIAKDVGSSYTTEGSGIVSELVVAEENYENESAKRKCDSRVDETNTYAKGNGDSMHNADDDNKEAGSGKKIKGRRRLDNEVDQAINSVKENIKRGSLTACKITGQKSSCSTDTRPDRRKIVKPKCEPRDKGKMRRKNRRKKSDLDIKWKERKTKEEEKGKSVETIDNFDVVESTGSDKGVKVALVNKGTDNSSQNVFSEKLKEDFNTKNGEKLTDEMENVQGLVSSYHNVDKISVKVKLMNTKNGNLENNSNGLVGLSSQNNVGDIIPDLSDSDSDTIEGEGIEMGVKNSSELKKLSKQNKQYQCKYCSQIFLTELPYKKHVEKHLKHAFDCPECGKKFTNRRNLNSHRFNRTKQRTFNCDICNFVTTTACLLRIHKKKTHPPKETFQCHLCAKIVKTKSYLNVHLKYAHNIDDGKYLCPVCGLSLKRPKMFAKHFKEHMNEDDCADRKCLICGKVFKTKRHLRSHRRVHRERTHLCDFCGKGFTTRTKLQAHNRTHTGVKPYQCTICDYKSTQSGNLRLHMKVHEKEETKKQQVEDTAGKVSNIVSNVSDTKGENEAETNGMVTCVNNNQNMPGESLPSVSNAMKGTVAHTKDTPNTPHVTLPNMSETFNRIGTRTEEIQNMPVVTLPNMSETFNCIGAHTEKIQNTPDMSLHTAPEHLNGNTCSLPSYLDYLHSSGSSASMATAANTLPHPGQVNPHIRQSESNTLAQTFTEMSYHAGKDYSSVYSAAQMMSAEKSRFLGDRLHSSQLNFESSDLFPTAPNPNTSGITECGKYQRPYQSNHTLYATEHVPGHTPSETPCQNGQSSTSSQLCSQFSNFPESLYSNPAAGEYSGTTPLTPSNAQNGMFEIPRTELEPETQSYSDNFDIDYSETVQSIYDSNQPLEESNTSDSNDTTGSSSKSPLVWVYTVCNL